MSSTVPYIAPWQTGFEKYSTQVYTQAPPSTSGRYSWFVPAGQWWRVIYLSVPVITGVGATPRWIKFSVVSPSNSTIFGEFATTTQPAGFAGGYLFMPGSTSFAVNNGTDTIQALTPIPDVLWHPLSTFNIDVQNFVGNQDFWGVQTIAVEIYTEDRPGVLVPASPTPTML